MSEVTQTKGAAAPSIAQDSKRAKSSRRKKIERATVIGLGISVLVHLVIMLIAALVTIDFGFADAGGSEGTEVDFAIMSSEQLAELASPEIEYESFEVAVMDNPQAIQVDLLSEINQEQSVSELAESVAPSLNSGGASLSSTDSMNGSAGAGTGDGASFFGLEAQGRRFAYIVDISGSMNTLTGDGEATRWELTRSEIIRSIRGFESHAEFFVVLYSSNSVSLFGNTQWIRAQSKQIEQAASALFNITPAGGTQPLPAFQTVFDLDPRTDAIYFMTDGMLGTDVPTQLRSMNKRDRIPIHCILFGTPAAQRDAKVARNMMLNIAKNSGGNFTHIKDGSP